MGHLVGITGDKMAITGHNRADQKILNIVEIVGRGSYSPIIYVLLSHWVAFRVMANDLGY